MGAVIDHLKGIRGSFAGALSVNAITARSNIKSGFKALHENLLVTSAHRELEQQCLDAADQYAVDYDATFVNPQSEISKKALLDALDKVIESAADLKPNADGPIRNLGIDP